MPKTLILFGCGGHSRSVADIYLDKHPGNRLIFLDENALENETIFSFPVLKEWPIESHSYFFAIGDNIKRLSMFKKFGSKGLISILSSKAYFGRESLMETGCFVGNFCHIGPQTVI